MDAVLREASDAGYGAAVAAEHSAVEARREAVLARTLRQVEALQHSADLGAISGARTLRLTAPQSCFLTAVLVAVVLDAVDGGGGVAGGGVAVPQVESLRERAAVLGAAGMSTSSYMQPSPVVRRGGGSLSLSWR